MSQKYRKAMVDKERLKTLAFGEDLAYRRSRRRYDRFYFTTALLWALAAALPSLYVGRPVPYMPGSTATQDILSRSEFSWRDERREAQLLSTLDANFNRRYREVPLDEWITETHGSVDRFLTRIAASDTLEEVVQAARELDIAASEEQLAAFWHGASFARNDPFHYLVSPVSEILENEIFQQGVIARDRYEEERGRNIEVIRGESINPVMVGGEQGPLTPEQVGPLLERRFRVKLSVWLPDDFKDALQDVVARRIRPSLFYDPVASRAGYEERREELLAPMRVRQNDVLVRRGETLTLDKMAMLREEEGIFQERQGWRLPATRFTGNFMLFAAISLAMVVFFKTSERSRVGTLRRFFATSLLALFVVFFGYWLIFLGLPGTLLPIGIAVGVAAFGMNSWIAMFLASVTALCGLTLFEGRPDLMVAHLAAAMFFINTAAKCRWRVTLMIISFLAGLIGAVAYIAWNFAQGDLQSLFAITSFRSAVQDSLSTILSAVALLLNWVVCGLVMLLAMPLVERFFGVTTRIRLQDLSAEEHPLLRRLVIEAPGTYHHCSIVSTLAEAAANAIGADGLKARIGGMFHDVGKLLKPEYFTENEFGVSRHENMNPNMSALLIINHVRDGAEMARTFGLPHLVVDMILQHHGDGLMKFFYHKATEQATPGAVVSREPFLYPGPKPQSPEAGILMIADSVEAAVRSLDSPSPAHLRTLLSRLVRDRLMEGQFEESGLSMRQLAQVEEVLYRMLVSMYHKRVKYPGQDREKGGRKR